MKALKEFKNQRVKFLFTDIDDTLTHNGHLQQSAYSALWDLYEQDVQVIPVTGRPAGWCELIARQWPVAGVIGENGGFYFRYKDRQMKRFFTQDVDQRQAHQTQLGQLERRILSEVPGSAIASDQFCRLMDLAIDYREDVTPPLDKPAIEKIIGIFTAAGAQAKVSSIHINGWFGDHNKLTTCITYMRQEWGTDLKQQKDTSAFVGDSPNDEPMFAFFPNSFGVANVKKFLPELSHPPAYIATAEGGEGFRQIADRILAAQRE